MKPEVSRFLTNHCIGVALHRLPLRAWPYFFGLHHLPSRRGARGIESMPFVSLVPSGQALTLQSIPRRLSLRTSFVESFPAKHVGSRKASAMAALARKDAKLPFHVGAPLRSTLSECNF